MDEGRRRRITSGEAAKILGVNVKTLRDWADKGYIKHTKTPSGRRWFDADVLAAFMESMQAGKLAA